MRVVGVGPRLAELRAHPSALPIGQMPADVAGFVDLTALYQRPWAGDVAHGLAERFGAVKDVELLLGEPQPAVDESARGSQTIG